MLKCVVLDALTGFVALGFVIGTVVFTRHDNDFRILLIITAVLFLLAGILRGQSAPKDSWLKGLRVSSGGFLALIAMAVTGMAFTAHPQATVILFVLVSLSLAICGVSCRRAWARGSRKLASIQVLLPVAVVTLGSLVLVPPLMGRLSTQQMDRPLPPFSFSDLDGHVLNSSDLKGHVVVLAFWATWCAPCISELPELQELAGQYKCNAEVKFWAVDPGWGGDTVEKARSFAVGRELAFPLAFDSKAAARVLGVVGLPTVVVLDKAGHIRTVHAGYDASEHLAANISKTIDALLREPG